MHLNHLQFGWESKKKKRKNVTKSRFEETILFKKRTSIRSTEGRRESECCFVLIGNRHGFVGVGFGFASSAVHALQRARKKAFLNIRSVETTDGTIIQDKIKKKYKKSIVEMQKSTKSGIRAHPVLAKMCKVKKKKFFLTFFPTF